MHGKLRPTRLREESLLLFALTFILQLAHADTLTGNVQPIFAPYSECTIPPSALPPNAVQAQVVSRFSYWACREYRSLKTGVLYYVLESVADGEYIHLIPPLGATYIDPNDYTFSAQNAVASCNRIHAALVDQMVPLATSRCRSP